MSNLINANEILLMFGSLNPGEVYCSDSTIIGRTYTLDMLLDEPGDSCPKIMVLNLATNRSTDVTERFAKAWLDREDSTASGVQLGDEDTLPAFVRNSRAWALLKDDLEAEQPVRVNVDHVLKEAREAQHA